MTVKFSIRVPEPDATYLASRAERMASTVRGKPNTVPLQARAEIGLLRALLDAELARMGFTVPQLSAIAEVLNSPEMEPRVAAGLGLVYAQCDKAFRLARLPAVAAGTGVPLADYGPSSYGAHHGFDEQQLLDYLARLGPAADHALADAISRWWAAGLEATPEGFAAVGLKVIEP